MPTTYKDHKLGTDHRAQHTDIGPYIINWGALLMGGWSHTGPRKPFVH